MGGALPDGEIRLGAVHGEASLPGKRKVGPVNTGRSPLTHTQTQTHRH